MTSTGRLALRLDVGGFVLLVVAVLIVGLLEVHALSWVALAALVAMVAGGAIALLAIVRDHERSALVVVALVPAAFALFLLIGELAFLE